MATAKKATARKSSAGKTAGKKTAGQKTAARKAPARARATDATTLLAKDHKDVKTLFRRYEKLVKADAVASEREELAAQICEMLTVHTTVEEEIFYPAVRAAQVDADLLDEAAVEHASAKDLIAQIRAMSPDDDLYDAKVKVLGEYVDHHVDEEEGEIFPACRKAKMDLAGLGATLAERKSELLAESPA
jgi:hemerythrin superfamily protein